MVEGPEVPAVVEASPDDVAAILRARTKDSNSTELGVFTADTRPTYEQVDQQIQIARALTRNGLGDIPDQCVEGAEATIALLASLLCEASYFPEQVQTGRSPYDQLRLLYDQARTSLVQCVLAHQPGRNGGAYQLDLAGGEECRPVDWWQRNLDR